jgi:FKBP-type peptidyl-prolyl cis-trans isomerase
MSCAFPFEARDSIFENYLMPDGTVNEKAIPKVDGSYAIGMEEGYVLVSSLVGRGIDQQVYVDLLVMGVQDGLHNIKPVVPLSDARKEVYDYYSKLNKSNGEQFLAENATRDSVVVTESGLQYQVFKEGKGLQPNLTDTCVVHYTGRFLDGREFESTIPSQKPYQLTLMGVIPGWQEGLQLMHEGSRYRFFIPHHLAYGEAGSGPIEPFSTLVFDIELIKVKRFQ